MTPLQAHGLFALAASEGRVDRWPVELRLIPSGPLEMAAMAVVSGWLEDADSEEELLEAVQQAEMLADCGVKHLADFNQAIEEVLAALHNEASALTN